MNPHGWESLEDVLADMFAGSLVFACLILLALAWRWLWRNW